MRPVLPVPEWEIHEEHPVREAVLGGILEWWNNRPRTQQTTIGPSGIGDPCDKCLTRALAGMRPTEEARIPWYPTIGVAMHEMLEAAMGSGGRWIPEQRVRVGELGGRAVYGNVDLYDRELQTVVDYKIIGKSVRDKARRGVISKAYFYQQQLYGIGLEDAGWPVHEVGLLLLPRDYMDVERKALFLSAPYDPRMGKMALERAQTIINTIKELPEKEIIKYINDQLSDPDCYNCSREASALVW